MKIFTQSKTNKRASLQISINAIVILVMAMVVLGLGLGFIRNLIGQGEEKLGRAIMNAELENPANAQTPITIDSQVSMKSGGTGTIHIGWYNANTGIASVRPADSDNNIDCFYERATDEEAEIFKLVAPVMRVEAGTSQGWEAIIKATDSEGELPGAYTCNVPIMEGDVVYNSATFILMVTK